MLIKRLILFKNWQIESIKRGESEGTCWLALFGWCPTKFFQPVNLLIHVFLKSAEIRNEK